MFSPSITFIFRGFVDLNIGFLRLFCYFGLCWLFSIVFLIFLPSQAWQQAMTQIPFRRRCVPLSHTRCRDYALVVHTCCCSTSRRPCDSAAIGASHRVSLVHVPSCGAALHGVRAGPAVDAVRPHGVPAVHRRDRSGEGHHVPLRPRGGHARGGARRGAARPARRARRHGGRRGARRRRRDVPPRRVLRSRRCAAATHWYTTPPLHHTGTCPGETASTASLTGKCKM